MLNYLGLTQLITSDRLFQFVLVVKNIDPTTTTCEPHVL